MKKKFLKLPNFILENEIWKMGFNVVAGMDEVGRGSFAGPVVASAVAFAPMTNDQFPIINERGEKIRIDDSKKMTAEKREKAAKWIKENSSMWGIGKASVTEINNVGVERATKMAFRRAIKSANHKAQKRIQYLLLDAFYIPFIRELPVSIKNGKKRRQTAVVHGDEKSFSIASASIVAKVYRDSLMEKIGKLPNYEKYGWVINKGYGTKTHQKAIIKYGLTKYHRKQFVETFLSKSGFLPSSD